MSLQSLPVEILERIVNNIDSPKTLAQLHPTCKLLHAVVEKPLYRSVLIANSKAAAFAAAFSRNHDRKALVREVVVDCGLKQSENEHDRSACTEAPLFAEFENLEVLSLTSSYWHWDDSDADQHENGVDENGRVYVRWETDQDSLTERFRRASLSCAPAERIWTKLTSCVLDFSEMNGQGWYCTFEPEVMLVASLQELTIRGCRFTDDTGLPLVDSPFRGQTALRKLTLERSYLHHESIFNFLCAPEALTHLVLGHDSGLWHHEMGNQPVTSKAAEDYMKAFRLQRHSLQFLSMSIETCELFDEGAFDFSAFPDLRGLEVDRDLVGPIRLNAYMTERENHN